MSFGYPCALAQCATNAYNALALRHLTSPPNRCTHTFRNVFLEELSTTFRANYHERLEQMVADEWRIGKKLTKLNAIDTSYTFDVRWHNHSNAFPKFEVEPDIPSKARLIQANRTEVTAYEFPEEYEAISYALSKVQDTVFTRNGVKFKLVYAGSSNHDTLSEIFNEEISKTSKHRLFDEADGKNWDSTMQKETLDQEAQVYHHLGSPVEHPFRKRSNYVRGRIFCKYGQERVRIKYVTRFKRLSGDWNTSAGNTIISMIIRVDVYARLPSHLRPTSVFAFFMGDDLLALLDFDHPVDPTELHAALNKMEEECGITPIRGIFSDPTALSFISLGLWPRHDGGYSFVPHPAKQLRKIFWSTKHLHVNQVPDYQSAIAISFWDVYWGFPLMMNFLKHHYTKRNPKFLFDNDTERKIRDLGRGSNVDWASGFMQKYDVPFSACNIPLKGLPQHCVVFHPLIEEMLRVELQNPMERRQCLSMAPRR